MFDFDRIMEHRMFDWRIDANELSGRIVSVLSYALMAYIAYMVSTFVLELTAPIVVVLYSSIGIGVAIGCVVGRHSNSEGDATDEIGHTNADTSRDERN